MKVPRILVAIAVSALAGRASGQTLTTLVQFGATVTNGLSPVAGLVQGSDGSFYGTTQSGGTNGNSGGGYGTVFKITSQGTLTTLYQFGGVTSDGQNPQAGLVQGSDGYFYSTTHNGGTNGPGTVFQITSQGTLTTLWQFGGISGAARAPVAGLVQGSDSNFYGTTLLGGTHNIGTVFRITSQGTLTTLYQFGGLSTDGRNPKAGLVQGSNGNFYGTTQSGGTNFQGTVFRITPQGTLTTLYQFGSIAANGGNIVAGLVQGIDSNFYGTTSSGGINTFGTVFRITPQGTLTTLYQFGNRSTDGKSPEAKLVQGSDSNFYGTTFQGGTNGFGTVFRITSQGTLTTLWQFGDLPIGSRSPQAGLVQGNDGNFYGTTSGSGSSPSGQGTVFKITPQGTLTTLWQFNGPPPVPAVPQGGLVQGSDSNFYGTTVQGGTNYDGTVYKMTSQGTVTVLHDFGSLPNDGVQPLQALVQSGDDNFYGTTLEGGTNGVGTVFRISPSGSLTTLWSFCSMENGSQFGGCFDGEEPSAGLVQGNDGSFYGTTQSGGTSFAGNVFRISPDGSFTNLHTFTGGDFGQSPNGLVQGSDGNFYGTTTFGGSCLDSCGTVFKIDAQGTFATLHEFTIYDGKYPDAALVHGSDGDFYGTTSSGGTNACSCGIVFKISPEGTLTSLYNFGGLPSDGSAPFGKMVQGSDGAFYGTTPNGGTNNLGTVFRITSEGTLTTLWQFGGIPGGGKNPYAGLMQGYDGDFYGTTVYGGTNDQGTVYKLSVPLAAPPYPINQITDGQVVATNIIFDIVSVAGETYQLQFSNSMNPTNWVNVPGVSVTNSIGALLTLTNFGGASLPQGFYRFDITP